MGRIRFADEHFTRLAGSVQGAFRQRLQLFDGDSLEQGQFLHLLQNIHKILSR
jgi:hypothetical protein